MTFWAAYGRSGNISCLMGRDPIIATPIQEVKQSNWWFFNTAGALVDITVKGLSIHPSPIQHFAQKLISPSNSVLTFLNNIYRHICYCLTIFKFSDALVGYKNIRKTLESQMGQRSKNFCMQLQISKIVNYSDDIYQNHSLANDCRLTGQEQTCTSLIA